MGLPEDFILQGGKKNINHICQNVPVTTAQDMADHVYRFVTGRLDNQLIETTSANIFVKTADGWVTPLLDRAGVRGGYNGGCGAR